MRKGGRNAGIAARNSAPLRESTDGINAFEQSRYSSDRKFRSNVTEAADGGKSVIEKEDSVSSEMRVRFTRGFVND